MTDSTFSLLGANSRALVLCPHTDDELGCAGTIIRLREAGVRVKYVALSRCEESVPEGFPRDALEHECRACTAALGIPDADCEVWNLRVRYFPRDRQEILERFVTLARSYTPDVVLLPSADDTHQDHLTVATEGFRAFKHSTLLGYELPQNLASFENTAFVKLAPETIDRKIAAVGLYRSQQFRPYASAAFIRSLATVRGMQCRAEYAEAFDVRRLML